MAGDIELYLVAHDFAGDVVAYGAQKSFHGYDLECTYSAIFHSNGVVVVIDMGQSVLRRTVRKRQLADHSCLQQQLDCPVNGSPTDSGKFGNDLFSAEALLFVLQQAYHVTSRSC